MILRCAAPADGCWPSAAALALIASLALPTVGEAQDLAPVELRWDAPASCPTAAEARARIEALAGASSPTDRPLRAAATITRNADGSFHLKLLVSVGELVGERTLDARSCADLAGATAVYLALLLEDARSGAQDAQTASDDNAAPIPVSAAVAAPVEPERDQASTSEPHGWEGVLQAPVLSWSFGPVPAPSFGLTVAGGLLRDSWSFLAKASLWLPHSYESQRLTASVKLDRVAAGLQVCRAVALGWLTVAPCASLSLEQLWARGAGPYVRADTAGATWLAVGVGMQARFPLASWLQLVGTGELKLHTATPRISIDGVDGSTELGMTSVELSLGTQWIL